jgi:hypothetical protein
VSEHTPTPWTMKSSNVAIADTGDYDGLIEIIGADGTIVVRIWGDADRDEINARFIERAANCHYSLVAALQEVMQFEYDSGDGNQYGMRLRQIPKEFADAARAAIAKAEGNPT